MATIQEKIKEGKIVSYKFKGCLGRDEGGKQVFKCITWYPPENLTKAKSKKEAERTAAVWESELKQAYCYMERSISGMVGKGSLSHNNREFFAENVDQSRSGGNITSVQKVPLSSKVMLDRDDYEALAAAAEKFVVQEKRKASFGHCFTGPRKNRRATVKDRRIGRYHPFTARRVGEIQGQFHHGQA